MQKLSYTYDPWGVPTVTGNETIAALNPCSYRCYEYDEETGYYYLQSRYYNPENGRFLNADDTAFIGSKKPVENNIFTYCGNNAINFIDKMGFKAIDITTKLALTMYINALYLYNSAKLYRWAGHVGKLQVLYKFYTLVKTKGEWDFKNQKEWQLKSGDYYVFMGVKVQTADLGNIHFGYVGSVLFSWLTLCTGAGLYQIYSGTSSWSFWYSFFDDPRDTVCITLGRSMWRISFNKWIFQW